MPSVRCDWLDVTTPVALYSAVCAELRPFLEQLGAVAIPSPGGGTLECATDWNMPTGSGRFKLQRWGQVLRLSASGDCLEAFRTVDAFEDYLRLLACFPHAVTRLDACLDVLVDGWSVIPEFAVRLRAGVVQLSRQAVKPSAVEQSVRSCLYDAPGGALTGSVYTGKRGSSALVLVVYDKRNERLDRGYPDPGPCTRYELRLFREVRCTLRDVWDPTAVFWHYVSPEVMIAPDGVTPWTPEAVMPVYPPRALDWDARVLRLVEGDITLRCVMRDYLVKFGPEEGKRRFLSLLSLQFSRLVDSQTKSA